MVAKMPAKMPAKIRATSIIGPQEKSLAALVPRGPELDRDGCEGDHHHLTQEREVDGITCLRRQVRKNYVDPALESYGNVVLQVAATSLHRLPQVVVELNGEVYREEEPQAQQPLGPQVQSPGEGHSAQEAQEQRATSPQGALEAERSAGVVRFSPCRARRRHSLRQPSLPSRPGREEC